MSFGDQHRILVRASALHAAGAIARLVGLEEPTGAPELTQLTLTELCDQGLPDTGRGLVVCSDISGAVSGKAGLLLSREAIRELLRQLVTADLEDELSESALSALTEVGNIAVSAAAGVLGHLAGGVVIPSVPRLGSNLAVTLAVDDLDGPAGSLPAYRCELRIGKPREHLELAFVFIPAP